jgi:hypothetical protein
LRSRSGGNEFPTAKRSIALDFFETSGAASAGSSETARGTTGERGEGSRALPGGSGVGATFATFLRFGDGDADGATGEVLAGGGEGVAEVVGGFELDVAEAAGLAVLTGDETDGLDLHGVGVVQ